MFGYNVGTAENKLGDAIGKDVAQALTERVKFSDVESFNLDTLLRR